MMVESSHFGVTLALCSPSLASVIWFKRFFRKKSSTPSQYKTNPDQEMIRQDMAQAKSQSLIDGINAGTLFNDRYLIKAELGRGGFGIVYYAEDQKAMKKPVVIKCLLDANVQSKNYSWYVKKFNQEQEALVLIEHPNVVQMFESGLTPGRMPFFVMEFVRGKSLEKVIESEEISFERIALIIEQTCKAISAAHEVGVLHCDLKPANIMIQSLSDGEDHVKVIDFGIAKISDSQFHHLNDSTRSAGTFPYMAPEQLDGKVCKQSDVYALGMIAYQMATKLPPINTGSLIFQDYGVRLRIAESNLMNMCAGFPETAKETILKAIAFKPEDRYQQVRDFGRELARALKQPSS